MRILRDAKAPANAAGRRPVSSLPSVPNRHSYFPRLTYTLLIPALLLTIVAVGLFAPSASVRAQDDLFEADDLAAEMAGREAKLLYQVNLERDLLGFPPLRWNRELSESERWFAKDTVDTTPITCDHTDSLGEGISERTRRFGYTKPSAMGQLLVCGFIEPQMAIWAWMSDPENEFYQKQMLLDPRYREAGTAYYLNSVNRRGMVSMALAGDLEYAPVVINLEAPSTLDANVSLYIYPTKVAPVSIKVSSNATFAGAEWEPYVAEKNWALPAGTGWRTVYVLTRDASGAISLASDSIWLGDAMPMNEISLDQASSIGVGYQMEALPAAAGEKVRFSLGWEFDDSDNKYVIYRGSAEAVADEDAVAGAALRLRGGERETMIRTTFEGLPSERILTMFVRLKTESIDNPSGAALLTLTVDAGGQIFGPVAVRASDFKAAGEWQEFAVNFIVPVDAAPVDGIPMNADLTLAHAGVQTVLLDTVRVYSQPVRANQQIVWPMDQSGLRNRAVQARFEGPDGLGSALRHCLQRGRFDCAAGRSGGGDQCRSGQFGLSEHARHGEWARTGGFGLRRVVRGNQVARRVGRAVGAHPAGTGGIDGVRRSGRAEQGGVPEFDYAFAGD